MRVFILLFDGMMFLLLLLEALELLCVPLNPFGIKCHKPCLKRESRRIIESVGQGS